MNQADKTARMFAPRVHRFAVEDVDDVQRLADLDGWGVSYLQCSPGRVSGTYRCLDLPGVRLVGEDYGDAAVLMAGRAPWATAVVAMPFAPGRAFRVGRQVVTDAHAVLFGPGEPLDLSARDGLNCISIRVHGRSVRRIGRMVQSARAEAGRAARLAGPAITELRAWALNLSRPDRRATGRTLVDCWLGDVSGYVASRLAAALRDRSEAIEDPRYLHARRARALMDAQTHEPLALAELSAETGASVRTLQYAFRECYGVSPARYHVLRRLNGAYRDLKAADPAAASVTRTATKWGFFHLGRFSQTYRNQFGELPSETLAGTRLRTRSNGGLAAPAGGADNPLARAEGDLP